MDRRKYLGVAGTLGITSVAGCGGKLKAATRSGPPHFEEVELTGPDEVTVGEEFSLTVSAKNTGGESGDFTNTLTVGEGVFQANSNIRIKDIGVTKSESANVGPIQMGYTGEYKFRITDYGASHTVSVMTNQLATSSPFALEDGPKITISDISFHPTLNYTTPDETELLTPHDGRIFAKIQLSVENRGDSDLYVSADSFDVPGGEMITEIGSYSTSLRDIQTSGLPLSTESVNPGGSKSGWIIAEVANEDAKQGLSIEWNRNSGTSSPEVRWDHGSAKIPTFEISSVEFPNEVEVGSTATGTATIENTGNGAGTFRGVLERRNLGDSEWQQLETISLDIDAGSSTTWSTEISEPYLGPSEYRLRPNNAIQTIDFVHATRSFEESYTTPDGGKITLDVGGMNFNGFSDSYTYDSYGDSTVSADSGRKFLFVHVTIENVGSEMLYYPGTEDFEALTNENSYPTTKGEGYFTTEFVSPVSGTEYNYGRTAEPGETESGWILFEVLDDVSVDDLTIRYTQNERIGAEWSA